MSRAAQIAGRLTKVGLAFVVGLLFYFVFYGLGWGFAALVTALALLPLGIILSVRGCLWIVRNGLWSLRNRLLVVYSLIGVLPVLLLFILFGLSGWALMNELAIYLASSALDRRLEQVMEATQALEHVPLKDRRNVAPRVTEAFGRVLPGMILYVNDPSGSYSVPANAPPIHLADGWKTAGGLLVEQHHFFGWSHLRQGPDEITALAPLSNRTVENLVPKLGGITLLEADEQATPLEKPAVAGSLTIAGAKTSSKDPDFRPHWNTTDGSAAGRKSPIPPAVNRLDIPVLWPSSRIHYHLDTPSKTYRVMLLVYSRPSAVLRTFFSSSERFRGVLFYLVVGVALLFLVVEMVAVAIGVSLTRRIMRAVSQMYEGTRRVIHGDFRHRIAVTSTDQLGELAGSFNQMTGNLERLLAVEKEKERLQAEIEIAREVQSQLYPKIAPPNCGLQLTVQCDPARMVSGDYYDDQEFRKGKVSFAIGDVAGKGISAALLMATLQAALRAQITSYQPLRENQCSPLPEIDAAELVSKLNQQVYAHTSPEKYATFFFAIFDQATCTLTYTNAGHLSPLLFREDQVTRLDSNGIVVGAFPFAKYTESCLVLKPGDLLVCYTDGITEPENAFGEEFGEQRLIDLVKEHAHQCDTELVRIVLDAVRNWTGSPELHDDMTLLLAREVQRV